MLIPTKTVDEANGLEKKKSSSSSSKPQYDPEFTDLVIAATGPKANPRLAQIMPSLLRHLHDFAREVDLTVAEWTAGVDLINQAGQMSDNKRNETQLLCDILGLESLVDEITSKLLQQPGTTLTPSAVLGPFYRAAAPDLPYGGSILQLPSSSSSSTPAGTHGNGSAVPDWAQEAPARLAHINGRVLSAETGEPIPGATVDVWQAAPNGLYEQQDPSQPDMNLRGRFATRDADGAYSLYCLRPTPYPVPDDGPSGRLLQLLDRHPYRPAHVHFVVSAPGRRTLTTQLFDAEDPYVGNDSVFATKKELCVRFHAVQATTDKDEQGPKWEVAYDFTLGAI
ncbi:catechol 1-2-dioxygenase 1 [Apiospora hydei]|uniref:Catechol 1-2-dioxygenase 1 n=1 Tax=Apiospora hydei TaxID=1337664 RepID=A0ABR1X1U1_9PEZI